MKEERKASESLFCMEASGNSMGYLIQEGDFVLVSKQKIEDYRIGDILVKKESNTFIAHRIISKRVINGKLIFVTKGDACWERDEPADDYDQIIGKVIEVVSKRKTIKLDSIKGKIISSSLFFISLYGFFLQNPIKVFLFRVLSCIKYEVLRLKDLLLDIKKNLSFAILSRLRYLSSPGVIKRCVQDFVLKTNKIIILKDIYRIYYFLAIGIVSLFPLKYRCIRSIYLRRQMAQGNFCAGSSDIDLTVIIKDIPWAEEARFIKLFWQGYFLLKRVLPVLGEVEILTEEELKNWAFVGGIRIWEVMSWRKVYGKEVRPCDKIVPSSDSLKLAYLSEAMQSFWILSMDISGKRRDDFRRYEYRKFFNLLVATLRFIDKIFNDTVSNDRQEFIANFITQHKESIFGKELAKFVGKVMNNVPKIENEMLIHIYSYLINYLNNKCQIIYQNLFPCIEEVRYGRFLVKTLNEKIDIYADKKDIVWEDSLSRLLESCENDILSILSNSHVFGGNTFVVLKQDLDIERIKVVCKQVFTFLSNKDLAIVTKDMLQCICNSLLLETAFNYWHITEQAHTDFGVEPKNYLARVRDDLVLLLFKKSVGAFNLCFRMFAINRNPVGLLYHSIDQIIRLHLALDRGIILSSLKDAIAEYKIHYKDNNSDLVSHLEKYLTLNGKELDEMSNEEIFYKNFEFIREEMTKLNKMVSGIAS